MSDRALKLVLNFIWASLIVFLAGCATKNTQNSPRQNEIPQESLNVQPASSKIFETKPGSLVYVPCYIKPVGTLMNENGITGSALLRGTCNIRTRVNGPFLGFWCATTWNCNSVNTFDLSQVPGKITGVAVDGVVQGHVALVTKIGTFYGQLDSNGNYEYGYLKKNSDLVFLGSFYPDGSFKDGTKIHRTEKEIQIINAANYKNNQPVGVAYRIKDNVMQELWCIEEKGCKVVIHAKNDNKIADIAGVIQENLLADIILAHPALRAIGAVVKSEKAIRALNTAYQTYGKIDNFTEISGILAR